MRGVKPILDKFGLGEDHSRGIIGAGEMPRAKCLFRRTDVTRACRAVEDATHKKVARVEIDKTGKIIVFPGSDDKTDAAPVINEWDEAAE